MTAYEANDNPPPDEWRDPIDQYAWSETKVGKTVLWYSKNGACPHCTDADGIRLSVEGEAYLGLRATDESDVFARCQCTGTHTRPDGVVQGCGWGGYVAGPKA